MKKHFRPPIQGSDFSTLFRYFWDHGVGRTVNPGELANPWSSPDLVDAFDTLGIEISERSIDNWLSGTFAPSPANLRALARIASSSQTEKLEWLDALIAARGQSKTKNSAGSELVGLGDNHQDVPNVEKGSNPSFLLAWTVSLLLAAAISVILLVFFLEGSATQAPKIENLRVCDQSRFDRKTKRCIANVSAFPRETNRIYASLELTGLERGLPFERIWFRCGERIHSKTSRNIEPWEGWTWFQSTDLEKGGNFALNVAAEEIVAVREFSIGEASQKTCEQF